MRTPCHFGRLDMAPWQRVLSTSVVVAFAFVPLASGEGQALPPHIAQMQLSTPKPVTEAQMAEFKQDFVDVDFNKDLHMLDLSCKCVFHVCKYVCVESIFIWRRVRGKRNDNC